MNFSLSILQFESIDFTNTVCQFDTQFKFSLKCYSHNQHVSTPTFFNEGLVCVLKISIVLDKNSCD
jgi:hypothetical protein